MEIRFKVNNQPVILQAEPLQRLIDLLRFECHCTEVKEGCGEGECGACTVLFNGKPVVSCLVSAAQAQEAEIYTSKGLAETAAGKIIARAFEDTQAVQCGFCFPGIMVNSWNYMVKVGRPDKDLIAKALTGNICRCTGYEQIIEAVELACREYANKALSK